MTDFWQKINPFRNKDKNTILIFVALIAIAITAGLIFVNAKSINSFSQLTKIIKFGNSPEEIAKRAVEYINSQKLAESPVSLINATEQSGVIKFKIKIDSQEYDSYVTKDGTIFFPYGIEMTSSSATPISSSSEQKPKGEIKKAEKPLLEAYVVSMCPFGLQMQRVLDRLVKELPEIKSYIKVRYIGSVTSDGTKITAMHGEEEAKENLRQICIREEQPNKYWDYISCFIKEGKSTDCEKLVGVDSAKLNTCTSTPDRGIAYAKEDFELNKKYNITGSPTLILNEVEVSEYDYGGRSLEALKSVVCEGFESQPSFCSKNLDTTQAAAGYSTTYSKETSSGSSSDNSASCGE